MIEVRGDGCCGGTLKRFQLDAGPAFVIQPRVSVDGERRWLWFSPGWLAVAKNTLHPYPGDRLTVEHEFYVSSALAKGFHIAGVITGATLGSPAGARAYQRLYDRVVGEYDLNPRVRLVAQSNGGLMHYAWAFRHPECVDRILGIYPATDLRSWPGLDKVCGDEKYTPPGLGYDMTLEELDARLAEFNPIDNVAPLVAQGVRILHIHGDVDGTVPLEPNSGEFSRRYRALGGEIEIEILEGVGHSPGPNFYASEHGLTFLVEQQ